MWGGENPKVQGITIVVEAEPAAADGRPLSLAASAGGDVDVRPASLACERASRDEQDARDIGAPLDSRFTFDNFVVGKPNEFAYAAARRVADAGKVSFNPLFLYGGVGLGKTHLMHAIAWHIRSRQPSKSVVYLSAEKFLYRFIRALREQNTVDFKAQFRSVDMLMIDDVQFISGKDSTQEEFFHTFNTLVDQGRQIVLSADKSPSDLEGMQERLKSRLSCGLVADIHATTYELRLGIIEAKAERLSVEIPKKVMEFLAHRISSNVRELEGRAEPGGRPRATGRPGDLAGDDPGGSPRPASLQRPPRFDRRHPEARRRALQHPRLGHALGPARPFHRQAEAGRDVPRQAAHHPVATGDRTQVRRPGPHHGDACGPQGRGTVRPGCELRRGHRAPPAHAPELAPSELRSPGAGSGKACRFGTRLL